ncbi:MAG: FAD:protein FMN transferase [Mesorhizobium sp.]|uniref:FAD:protein FMN transferase n=1 Tax=Mesorhizobium sp. TaxID=1871066 RepID=UPI000FE4C5C1|nr:FAD:protein FMN transferase [Mesorhizobium sp.]RWL81235.1 MAG: FAD:protein FMN transferase [Mesorhizobium sp.]RWL88311.1 MAG: FAD:protein FMN transferase [Mesorhizobium sp.]RWL97004.1 MAG: FAD:protein FMN transferase [Mesorhizobium sp.]RWM02655.1 MAG: FAD:protein FMN transferase [Mesorhizobium sp.]TIP04333.1 MAG: FAD:protein FMN transferase [Mesorhizobium sp.]
MTILISGINPEGVLAGRLTRRRFIRISGAVAGVGLAALGAGSAWPGRASPLFHEWHGVALGADASLQLYHPDAAEAERLIADSLAEVRRLERVFSLYDNTSALSRLNRDGELADPPQELVELLATSARYARATGGAFDPTVQPLWILYANHFGTAEADPNGPSLDEIGGAVAKCGYQRVIVDGGKVAFGQPGMALTLNGIAQGYITDRVAELLRARGVTHTLVDMGETRALDAHPAGRPWSIGLKDPRAEDRLVATLALDNQAVSTSGGYGTEFDPAGRFNHIFDPSTGLCARRYLSVSVVAPTATCADALSTALSTMPIDRAASALAEAGATRAYFVLPDGRVVDRSS